MKRRYAIALLVTIAALAGAELAARHEGFGSPLLYTRTLTSYELVPDQHVTRLGRTTQINALGTRGADAPPHGVPGVWRIMLLGDSVANGGTALDDTQTFAALASHQLEAAHCPNAILNASAGGWSLADEASWVQRHGFFDARTVVWEINFMDLDQPPSSPDLVDSNPAFPSHRPASGLSEIIFRYLLPRLGIAPSTADKGSVPDGAFDERQFAANQAMVRSETDELKKRNIDLVVLYHDGLQPLPAARAKAETTFLSDLARQGIAVMQTPTGGAPDRASLYIDAIHPNRAGAERIAQALAKALLPRCPNIAIPSTARRDDAEKAQS